MIILYLIFLFSNIEPYYVNAPELIRGEALSYQGQLHISVIDGGDWQADKVHGVHPDCFLRLRTINRSGARASTSC